MDLTTNDRLRNQITHNLQQFQPTSIDSREKKHAAVAVAVVAQHEHPNFADIQYTGSESNQAAFILTVRAAKLNAHGGQRAFPGGRIDPGETPEQAALREMSEEVGLTLGTDCILGRLDDYATRSGFVMTPIVVWGGDALGLSANPSEVESIHRIPVNELLRDDAPILESIPESAHPVLKMPLGSYDWFAAPTAAIAYQFREVAILGKSTRVAHFEQPYFAWQ